MSRFTSQSGITLTEVLVAMTLMLVILGATLTTFTGFTNASKRSERTNEQQDAVRLALEQVVRQTRNLANPTTGATGATPTTIAHADEFRLVFQTTDPSKQWVMYCLDYTNATREKLYYQTSTLANLTPTQVVSGGMTNECPDAHANWGSQRLLGDYITNRMDPSNPRPLFRYYSTASEMVPGASGIPQGDTPRIVRVVSSVYLDLDTTRSPSESHLQSAAYMRNQNQTPTSAFTATSGSTWTFDAGTSLDPEGRTLDYDWYSAPVTTTVVPSASALPDCSASDPAFPTAPAAGSAWRCLGTTVVLSTEFTALPRYVFLRVTDPGNLQVLSTLPATGCFAADSNSRPTTQCGRVG